MLPTEAGAVVRTALEALAGKRGPEDERKREVRLAHALVELWRHHWMVHEGEWQLVRSQDGRVLTIPPVPIYCRGPDIPDAA